MDSTDPPDHHVPPVRRSLRERLPGARQAGIAALGGARGGMIAALSGLLLWSVAPVAVGWQSSVIVSGSMSPAIEVGDIVAASKVSKEDATKLRTGTVVLVDDPAAPGRLLLHRFVKYNKDGQMITKGDANESRDSTPVPLENLRGMGRLRIPAIGLPVVWLQHGRYAPVAAISLLLLVILFWRPERAIAATPS